MEDVPRGHWTPPQTPPPIPPSSPPLPPPPPPPPPRDHEYPAATRPKLRSALEFIRMVKEVTLASQFSPEELADLLDPQEHDSTPPDDPSLKLSLLNFISFLGSPQGAYEAARENTQQCYPDIELLSYYQVARMARILSGVITWEHDMCVKSCAGFTGPFEHLQRCPDCGELRYKEKEFEDSGGQVKIPRKVFTTFPVGPQLQARWKHARMAREMFYRWEKTQELRQERGGLNEPLGIYDDILCGEAYLDAVDDGVINEYDTVLMLSIDGAQLYESKQSDCWIYIWLVVDLGPDKRYKIRNVLPGGIIPGPDHPKDLDSFLFPGVSHVAALQREGLPIWDAYHRRRALSFLFLLLVLADAVAMAQLSGSVGHHGRKGCRLFCGFAGRNKINGPHYYPALLRPNGFENHRTSSHPNIDIHQLPVPNSEDYRRDLYHVISSRSQAEYKRRRFDTGIGKPSIFDAVPRILDLPTCFAGDLMHQPLINLAALLLDLWCARPEARDHDRGSIWPWAVLTGDVWKEHGKDVARAARHLPTSFGRVPRNPQEKISSGYKASELLYYIYGLGPAVFYQVIQEPYYSHFCRLVRAIRIIYQRTISRDQMLIAHQLLLGWCLDFETLYCGRNPDRLHFVRQCVHSLTHLARETHRLGPLSLSSQWTMERVIGYLGSLLRQPSNAFRNLAAQTARVAHTNALVAMWPDFEKTKGNPRGSEDLGDGYLLLGPKDTTVYNVSPPERAALESFFSDHPGAEDVDGRSLYRWGRLKIPTEQVARSRWKELECCSDMARTDRNIKVCELILFRHNAHSKYAADLISKRYSLRGSQILLLQDVWGRVARVCSCIALRSTKPVCTSVH